MMWSPAARFKKAKTLALAAMVAALAACGQDSTTVTAPTVVKPTPLGTLRVVVTTWGAQSETSGYVITLNGIVSNPVGANDSIELVGLRVGQVELELSGLPPKCWVEGNPRQLAIVEWNVVTGVNFVVSCHSFDDGNSGEPLVGFWHVLKWEFFEHADFTGSNFDMVAAGLSSDIQFAPTTGWGLTWTFSGTQPSQYGVGPGHDLNLSLWGHAAASGTNLDARLEAPVEISLCPGDCEGPLHGVHRFSISGDTLVISRPDSVDSYPFCDPTQYEACAPVTAWTRLTLLRK